MVEQLIRLSWLRSYTFLVRHAIDASDPKLVPTDLRPIGVIFASGPCMEWNLVLHIHLH
jgi:hypothetical protein